MTLIPIAPTTELVPQSAPANVAGPVTLRDELDHSARCYDHEGKLECVCGLDDIDAQLVEEQAARLTAETGPPDDYGDPLFDREPMGGDPYWRDDP